MKNRTELKREKKQKRLNRVLKVRSFFKWLLIMMVMVGFIIGGGLVMKYYPHYKELSNEADEIVENIDKNTFRRLPPTRIVRGDETVREFKHAEYKYINEEDIPESVKHSFVSIEDPRFYEHRGIDFKANLRAVKALISNRGEITQGASTITQQLVKNIFLTNEQTYERKIKEIILSFKIEKEIGKDEILEYYLNNINFGNGAYGIETASSLYFNKSADKLTLSETALLTAIPNNPTIYDPIENMENTIKRRDRILDSMYDKERISEKDLANAKKEEIELDLKEKEEYKPESYEVSFVLDSAVRLVMENQGFEMKYKFVDNSEREKYEDEFNQLYQEVNGEIRAGGYTIESTIDPQKQEQLQSSINGGLTGFQETNEAGMYQTQGAGVTIDNETGEVVAIVGGRTQENIDNTYNRAALAHRQPGSLTKPILSYGIEIDHGMLTNDRYTDKKDPKGPNNVTRSYKGSVTAREALERSINTIPFAMIKNRGTQEAHEYMEKMEFKKITDEDRNAGISIGGFTHGTTPLEIAGAFHTLYNNGKYIRPTGIKTIKFVDDEIYKYEREEIEVYKDGSTYLLTDMMRGVLNKKHGTGNRQKLNNMDAAAKTGTTDGNKDGWFSGYTPYYTTTIWVGNDNSKPVYNLYGSTYPGNIWKNYMNEIHKGLKNKKMEPPKGTKKMYVNPNTRDISEHKKAGYTRYELVPGHYIKTVKEERRKAAEKARKEREKREREEKKRREEALAREKKRLAEFKKKYGISESDELNRKAEINRRIDEALSIYIDSESDYSRAYELLKKAESTVGDLMVKDNRDEVESRINTGYTTLKNKRENMYQRIEEEKRERERKKREEEERKKREEEERERKEKEEEERKEREEKERKEREEEERKKREEEEQEEEEAEEEQQQEENEENTEEDEESEDD